MVYRTITQNRVEQVVVNRSEAEGKNYVVDLRRAATEAAEKNNIKRNNLFKRQRAETESDSSLEQDKLLLSSCTTTDDRNVTHRVDTQAGPSQRITCPLLPLTCRRRSVHLRAGVVWNLPSHGRTSTRVNIPNFSICGTLVEGGRWKLEPNGTK